MIIASQHFAQPSKEDIPETYGKGRRCLECRAFLCQYNPASVCWCHQPDLDEDGILIRTEAGWKSFPLTSLISRKRLAELVPNRG